MRISDWSSDVCSSDLAPLLQPLGYRQAVALGQPQVEQGEIEGGGVELLQGFLTGPDHLDLGGAVAQQHVLDVEGKDRVVLQDEQAQAWGQRWVTRCLHSSFGLLSGVLSLPHARRWSAATGPLGGGWEGIGRRSVVSGKRVGVR